jgi:hypothetical protein
MRFVTLAAIAVTAGIASPSLAAEHRAGSLPTFDDCYRLAWVRGVHVERDELPGFDEECMANKVPFESGYSISSIRRGSKQMKD